MDEKDRPDKLKLMLWAMKDKLGRNTLQIHESYQGAYNEEKIKNYTKSFLEADYKVAIIYRNGSREELTKKTL